MGFAGVHGAPCHHVGVELVRRFRSRVEWKRTCYKNAAFCVLWAVIIIIIIYFLRQVWHQVGSAR